VARSFFAPWVLLLAIVVAYPSVSTAQVSDDAQAHAHFEVAASYYEQANYESALREFLEAYRLSQRSQLFYNLSLCYQQLGDLQNAVDYLARYLSEVTEIANRASLQTRLENLRARLAAHEVAPPVEEHPTETTTTTTAAEPVPPVAATSPPPTSSGGDSLNVGAIASFSVAGVGLILGAVFTGLAASENSRISGLPCASSRTCSDGDLSGMRTDALVADIMWGVSLAGAAVGLILLLVNPGGSSSASEHAGLRFNPGSLSLEGTF